MMSNCKTCQWFGEKVEDEDLHVCERIRGPRDWGYRWQDDKRVRFYEDTDEVFDEPAEVMDGSGYTATLRVKPDFGCVLWEAKEEKEVV
jgi:hypothetical protein